MELDAHALKAFQDDHTIGETPKCAIKFGDDHVVPWTELSEQGATALSLLPRDFARLRRVYKATHDAELITLALKLLMVRRVVTLSDSS